MHEIRTVYLCGLGALGSSYAKVIHACDPAGLKVIANAERIQRYKTSAPRLNGEPLRLSYLCRADEAPPADLIIVAVKQHQLADAIEEIIPFVADHTIVLSFLNGIQSEEIIGRRVGMEKLLHSFVVETDAMREGLEVRFSKLGTVVFGEREQAAYSAKVQAVRAFFDRCGIPYRIPENIIRELWWKFMLNVGVNQISALLRAPYGVFHCSEDARQAVRLACREVVQLSEKAGVNLTEADIDACFPIFGRLAPGGKTSMLQDVESQRPTEVDLFAGTVKELGRSYAVPTPVNDLLYALIRCIESSPAGSSS